MVWKGVQHQLANHLLRGKIGLGHQVGRPLFADAEPSGPIQQHRPAGAGRLVANLYVVWHYVTLCGLVAGVSARVWRPKTVPWPCSVDFFQQKRWTTAFE